MPSVPLPVIVADSAFTTKYLWYSNGATLRRRNLKTHVDEQWRVYPHEVHCIGANDECCVIMTRHRNGDHFLWTSDSFHAISIQTGLWVLTPRRLVYEEEGDIFAYNFVYRYQVARGKLCGASDTRVLCEDRGVRKWDNGTSAPTIRSLRSDDTVTNVGDPLVPFLVTKEPYGVTFRNGRSYLICESRTRHRLERLLGSASASQLLNHA